MRDYHQSRRCPVGPFDLRHWARQWQAAEEIVYSRTLAETRSGRFALCGPPRVTFIRVATGCSEIVGVSGTITNDPFVPAAQGETAEPVSASPTVSQSG